MPPIAGGVQGVQDTDRVAATAVAALFGEGAGKLIAVVILVSMFSAANGLTLTAPRMYYAMARDGVFFQKLGEVHPKFGTPAFAIPAFSAAISSSVDPSLSWWSSATSARRCWCCWHSPAALRQRL